MALAAMEDMDAQAGRELRDLAFPVRDERRGRDDEGRSIEAPLLLLDEEVRDRLERLAEAHVVREDPAHSPCPQVLQPCETFDLVGPELRAQTERLVDRDGRRDELLGPGACAIVA